MVQVLMAFPLAAPTKKKPSMRMNGRPEKPIMRYPTAYPQVKSKIVVLEPILEGSIPDKKPDRRFPILIRDKRVLVML